MKDDSMRALLSTTSRKQLELVEYLIQRPHQTFKEIEHALNYNHKTIVKHIEDINLIISPCAIKKNVNNEIYIQFTDNCKIEYLYACFLKNNLEFNIIHKIIFNTNNTYLSLSTELYVNESTLRRVINKISTHLSNSLGFVIDTATLTLRVMRKRLSILLHII